MKIHTKNIASIALIAVSLLALSSCSDTTKPIPKRSKPKISKTQNYNATDFAEHIALAKLSLANGASLLDISDDGKVIETYSTQKNAKTVKMNIVILDYTNNGPAKRAFAPISENGNLNALSDVMAELGQSPYKINEIRVAAATVPAYPAIKITGEKLPDVTERIEARSQAIINNSAALPAITQAKLQLKLLRYFTASKNRDAAYLAADNSKRILSTLAQDGSDETEVTQLVKDLEIAEGDLRNKMPY